ncbi:BrnT family toxin [Castellaniella sp.]|uniref:BrnT family toxin n=1 Tax=Castellaniella sp. TaxID=1955812 RepID=UPI0035676EA7
MEITFDPAKDGVNQRKHGVSLALAQEFEWGDALVGSDRRRDYGEDRMMSIGYIGLRLYVVVYVDRAGERRIISLRKVDRREEKHYAEA